MTHYLRAISRPGIPAIFVHISAVEQAGTPACVMIVTPLAVHRFFPPIAG